MPFQLRKSPGQIADPILPALSLRAETAHLIVVIRLTGLLFHRHAVNPLRLGIIPPFAVEGDQGRKSPGAAGIPLPKGLRHMLHGLAIPPEGLLLVPETGVLVPQIAHHLVIVRMLRKLLLQKPQIPPASPLPCALPSRIAVVEEGQLLLRIRQPHGTAVCELQLLMDPPPVADVRRAAKHPDPGGAGGDLSPVIQLQNPPEDAVQPPLPRLFHEGKQFFQSLGSGPLVRILRDDPIPLRPLQGEVPGGGKIVNPVEMAHLRPQPLGQGNRPVGAARVHHDLFPEDPLPPGQGPLQLLLLVLHDHAQGYARSSPVFHKPLSSTG